MIPCREDVFDVAVIGAGSGGLGACLAAARSGLKTLLVEKESVIGGTAVNAGVNMWEPGAGGTGIPFEIFRKLSSRPMAAGIYSIGRHCCWSGSNKPAFPGQENLISRERNYFDTLRRHGSPGLALNEAFARKYWHGAVFEPRHYVSTVRGMLHDTGCVEVRAGVSPVEVQFTGGYLDSVTLSDRRRVRAFAWVDATDSAVLCRAGGARVIPRGGIPLNGVSLIYRITPSSRRSVEPLPSGIPSECWWQRSFPVMSCTQYPDGERNCNMLPTMSGEEFVSLGSRAALRESKRRVRAHWHHVQREFPEFRNYRISVIARRIGVRETVHLDCRYLLSPEDLSGGLEGQEHEDIIALADHRMDFHGAPARGSSELPHPYGIPFRCLIPKNLHNVMASSLAAGFTPEAASSCRLSRTMLQLGQAAGTAAAIACRLSIAPAEVPAGRLRASLLKQNVQLDWPMPETLKKYMLGAFTPQT